MSTRSSTDSTSSLARELSSIFTQSRSTPVSSSASSILTNSSSGVPMRVFLIQTARGLFSSSGGYKANICLLRYLASRGHSVRQLCYSHGDETEKYAQRMAKSSGHDPQLRRRTLRLRGENGKPSTDVNVAELVMEDGVEVVALESEAFDAAFGGKENHHRKMGRETAEYIETGTSSARLLDFVSFLQREITHFSPTHVISNDGLTMQASSAMAFPNLNLCRIGIVHTAEQLPFGPFAGGVPGMSTSARELDLLRQCNGIWSVSNAIQQYALKYGDLQTTFLLHHPWTYLGETKHEMPLRLRNWNKRFVGMINPCVVKGSQILVDLAKACPQFEFLVYKSWGFNDTIGSQTKDLRNMTLRPQCTDMEEAWRDIKVLLVPSIWFEAWGIVVVEAHLRGIPVISSDAGALPEAMLGLDHIVPVNAVDGKRDGNGKYVTGKQDIRPWVKALSTLISDQYEYERLSMRVRHTTEQWLADMDETALEKWLMDSVADSSKM